MIFREKLLGSIPNVEYVLDTLSDTYWYLAEEEDRKIFANNIFEFMAKNFDSLENNNLVKIMSSLHYFEINDKDLVVKLMKKSIECNNPILTAYNTKFEVFNKQEKTEYVKMLNSNNYPDFSHFKYKISEKNGKELLCDMYKDNYYSNNTQGTNTLKPCENFNLFILDSHPFLFINNSNIDEQEKIKTLDKFCDGDESGLFLYPFINMIKNNEIHFSELGIMDKIIKKVSLPKDFYHKKNNIISFFGILKHKEIIDYTAKKILEAEEIKNGLLSILSEKIKLPKNYDIRMFDEKVGRHQNMNFLQYLMFSIHNNFVTELCKRDKDFMKVFNNCLLENINGFNYEKSPLDLAIQGKIPSVTIDNLYIYKVTNNKIKPGLKDKVCAFLFKSIEECDQSQQNRYMPILNAITLMPPNLVNKYFNYYKEILSGKKLQDLETIKDMINMKNFLSKDSSNTVNKPKMKI
jgi:hypothetical protein